MWQEYSVFQAWANSVGTQQTGDVHPCCCNVGPASQKMGQHHINIVCMTRVCLASQNTDPSQSRHNKLNQCWLSAGPTVKQRWFNVVCLLGYYIINPHSNKLNSLKQYWLNYVSALWKVSLYSPSVGSKSLLPCWFYIDHSVAKHVCNRLKYVSVGKNMLIEMSVCLNIKLWKYHYFSST